jgi:hypothetical protein
MKGPNEVRAATAGMARRVVAAMTADTMARRVDPAMTTRTTARWVDPAITAGTTARREAGIARSGRTGRPARRTVSTDSPGRLGGRGLRTGTRVPRAVRAPIRDRRGPREDGGAKGRREAPATRRPSVRAPLPARDGAGRVAVPLAGGRVGDLRKDRVKASEADRTG